MIHTRTSTDEKIGTLHLSQTGLSFVRGCSPIEQFTFKAQLMRVIPTKPRFIPEVFARFCSHNQHVLSLNLLDYVDVSMCAHPTPSTSRRDVPGGWLAKVTAHASACLRFPLSPLRVSNPRLLYPSSLLLSHVVSPSLLKWSLFVLGDS